MHKLLLPTDIDAVLRVQRGAYLLPQLHESADVFRRKLDLFPQGAIGFFEGATLAAYIFFHPWTQSSIVPIDSEIDALPDRPDCIYIHDLSVDPAYRGKGIARTLFFEVLRTAKKMSISTLTLVAVQQSETFWSNMGFRPSASFEYLPGVAATKMILELPNVMDCRARRATLSDVDTIFEMGQADAVFKVSDPIRFYERIELQEWAQSPSENILLVSEVAGKIGGFLFCKVISSHWAMLDNFYVRPTLRKQGHSRVLFDALTKELRSRGISYLSTLISIEAAGLGDYLRHLGFQRARTYDWYEYFLEKKGAS